MNIYPVVLFCYNRPQHTLKTLEALSANLYAENTKLYVYCDGIPEGATELEIAEICMTREIVKKQRWCGQVFINYRTQNLGLASSIKSGVNEILQSYEAVIVLEDDIVTAGGFLAFMNGALSFYSNNKKIMHVGGYTPESSFQFLLPRVWALQFMSCWGWATWRDRWSKIQWDVDVFLNDKRLITDSNFTLNGSIDFSDQLWQNKNNYRITWAIYWFCTIAHYNGLCIYPRKSLVKNIGFDGSGIGFKSNKKKNPFSFLEIFNLNESVLFSFYEIKKQSLVGFYYYYIFYKYKKRSTFGFLKIYFIRKLKMFYRFSGILNIMKNIRKFIKIIDGNKYSL